VALFPLSGEEFRLLLLVESPFLTEPLVNAPFQPHFCLRFFTLFVAVAFRACVSSNIGFCPLPPPFRVRVSCRPHMDTFQALGTCMRVANVVGTYPPHKRVGLRFVLESFTFFFHRVFDVQCTPFKRRCLRLHCLDFSLCPTLSPSTRFRPFFPQ